MVCKPKDKGGLGILDFSKLNEGLLMKHLHKFYNKQDTPWVQLVWNYYNNEVPHASKLCGSFWWKDIMKLAGKYIPLCKITIGTGDTALFWSDKWHDQLMMQSFPRLFSYSLDGKLSVRDFLLTNNKSELFELPLSQQAYQELLALEVVLDQCQVHDGIADSWSTVWKGGVFSSQLYYKYCFSILPDVGIFKWIWKSRVIMRIKVFAWLLVSDRLNTKDMLRRRNWNIADNSFCVLCPTHITEDWMHLFFHCNFSARIWHYLQIEWEPGPTLEVIVQDAMRKFSKPFFSEVVIIALWHIWKQRNEAIFQGIMPSFRGWKNRFVLDLSLHKHRVKEKHVQSLSRWIDSLL
jgi:hypothetical protein